MVTPLAKIAEDHKDREALKELTISDLANFLMADDKVKNLLEKAYEIAMGKPSRESVQMLIWFLEKYFGKATIPIDIESQGRPITELVVKIVEAELANDTGNAELEAPQEDIGSGSSGQEPNNP
jgi:hypothetical protein